MRTARFDFTEADTSQAGLNVVHEEDLDLELSGSPKHLPKAIRANIEDAMKTL